MLKLLLNMVHLQKYISTWKICPSVNLQYVEAYLRFFDERSGFEEVKVEIGEIGLLCLVVQQVVEVEEVDLEKLEQQVDLFFGHLHILHQIACSQIVF